MKIKYICLALISLLWVIPAFNVWAAIQTTTTSLAVTSTNGVVTTVTSGSAVTLTATVNYGATAATVGQVNFCDATAPACTDIHLLGTAQLTSAGTASIKLVPAIGGHSYKAIFAGTPHGTTSLSGSTSAAVALSVSGLWQSATAIASSGKPGNYTLTATAGGGGSTAPTGSISFVDTSNNYAALGSAPLIENTAGLNFLSSLSFQQVDPMVISDTLQLVVGDFNGDGVPDVVQAASVLCTHPCFHSVVTALLGKGDGNFAAPETLDLGNGSNTWEVSALGSADFNEDGVPDLVLGNGIAQTLTVLLGSGTGTFSIGSITASGGTYESIAINDFNGDGIPDIAVANTTSNLITILLGKGDGTFTASTAAPSSTTSTTIATGDFNGDGIPDLIGITSGATATILLGNGDGTFTQVMPGPLTGGSPSSIVLGDFNGDGKTDIAFPNNTPANSLTILLGNGDGTFMSAAGSPFTLWSDGNLPGTGPAFVGDFNGDGMADLMIQTTNIHANFVIQGGVFLGDGTGAFTPAATVNGIPLIALKAGDFNGDGRTDIVGYQQLLMAATQTATATTQGFAVPPATGSHLIAAVYDGDSKYTSGSTSGALKLDAERGTPTITLTSLTPFVTPGSWVTVKATVSGSGLTPTGDANWDVRGTSIGASSSLDNHGETTWIDMTLPVGNNTVVASYGGDSNYTAADSVATTVVVTEPGTNTPSLTVTPSALNVTNQQSVTVTVSVAGASGQPTPTGALTLTGVSYWDQKPLTNGAVSFTVTPESLSGGSNTISATYLGDTIYKSINQTTTVTVSPAVMTVSAPAAVAAGAAGTSKVTLSASSTYSGTMKLACSLTSSPSGAQSTPTCSLNPTSVAITASGNGTATLTMQTKAATNTALAQPSHLGLWELGSGGILAGLIMLGVPSRRRRWMSMLGILLIVCAVGAIGCGGGSSKSAPPPPTSPTTPATTAGNYTFTVTGTDTADASITASTTVTLTVQ